MDSDEIPQVAETRPEWRNSMFAILVFTRILTENEWTEVWPSRWVKNGYDGYSPDNDGKSLMFNVDFSKKELEDTEACGRRLFVELDKAGIITNIVPCTVYPNRIWIMASGREGKYAYDYAWVSGWPDDHPFSPRRFYEADN